MEDSTLANQKDLSKGRVSYQKQGLGAYSQRPQKRYQALRGSPQPIRRSNQDLDERASDAILLFLNLACTPCTNRGFCSGLLSVIMFS